MKKTNRFYRWVLIAGAIIAIAMMATIDAQSARASDLTLRSIEQSSQSLAINSTETLTGSPNTEDQDQGSDIAEESKNEIALGLVGKNLEKPSPQILLNLERGLRKKEQEKIKNQNLHPAWLTFKDRPLAKSAQ